MDKPKKFKYCQTVVKPPNGEEYVDGEIIQGMKDATRAYKNTVDVAKAGSVKLKGATIKLQCTNCDKKNLNCEKATIIDKFVPD
jgi:hypothetical protein